MALFGSRRSLDHAGDDLSMVGPTLGDAINRFARAVINVSPRATTRASNLAAHFPRLRPAASRRPVRLPLLRAEALRRRTPKTVLNRRRVSVRRPGARPAIASSVEDSVGRVRGAIRDRLQALRAALLRLRRRLGSAGR